MVIVKGKTSRSLNSMDVSTDTANTKYTWAPKAYMTNELGVTWFTEVFLPNCGPERPQLLIMDSHSSHEVLGLLEAAKQNGIHIVAFPPHTTSHLSPLDRAVFGPLKKAYNRVCTDYIQESPSATVTKCNWPKLFSSAYKTAVCEKNIKAGFAATGLYPQNPTAVPANVFLPGMAMCGAVRPQTGMHPLANVKHITDQTLKTAADINTDLIRITSEHNYALPNEGSPEVMADELEVAENIILGEETGHLAGAEDFMMIDDDIIQWCPDTVVAEKDSGLEDMGLFGDLPKADSSKWSMDRLEALFTNDFNDTPCTAMPVKAKAHRILTSDEIISAKRQSIEIKERKEKEKRDRMEMRENKKAMANKKPKIVKKNATKKIHVGPHTINKGAIANLADIDQYIDDEIINAYMHVLGETSKLRVQVMDSVILSAAVLDQKEYLMEEINFDDLDVVVGGLFYNSNKHWTLLVCLPQKKQLLYINPMGASTEEGSNVLRGWSCIMNKRLAKGLSAANFSLTMPFHPKQLDSKNCGVFVMKFAECYATDKPTEIHNVPNDQKSLQQIRNQIATTLLLRAMNEA